VPIRRKKLKCFVGSALFAAFGLLIGTAAMSQAATSKSPAHKFVKLPLGMTAAEYTYQQEQAPLDAVATKIGTLAAKPGAARNGFVDTRVLPAQHTLVVYWHGAVPATVERLIAHSQGAIRVRVVKTRYSLATLNQQVQSAFHISGVAIGYPQTDGSGIVVGVRSEVMRSAAADLRTRITVPVTVTSAGPTVLQSCVPDASDTHTSPSRCHDFAPFWGGDVLINFADPGKTVLCSSGFGVHASSGATYLMTAAHCAYNGSAYIDGVAFYNGFDDALVGSVTDVSGPHDGAIIPTSSGAFYYDGPSVHSGDTNNTKGVGGSQTVSVNDSLCESGAFGGVHCGAIVKYLNASDGTWNSEALATSLSGAFTVGGDSGGPWFSLDGSTKVWAKGITHGDATVGGTEYNDFTPISILLSDTGTSVNTN
jgi:hypothetical protein